MAKISGTLSNDVRIIIVKETDWQIESNTTETGGNFSIEDLVSGTKTIIARQTTTGECEGFGNVSTVEQYFNASGGNITYSGDYKIHTFLTNGIFTATMDGVVDTLVVAGAGAGNGVGGGGAGGVLYIPSFNVAAGVHTIIVGNGGQGQGENGQNSVFSTLTAVGGGGGGGWNGNGKNGGSGGGCGHCSVDYGYHTPPQGGAGTEGQGYAGGGIFYLIFHQPNRYFNTTGGGGGAGAVGQTSVWDTPRQEISGNGGAGRAIDISGTSVYYGGGGGGGKAGPSGLYPAPGAGGIGGGGAGSPIEYLGAPTQSNPGTPNTGGGGGGGGDLTPGGGGGSGIVIIRYLIN